MTDKELDIYTKTIIKEILTTDWSKMNATNVRKKIMSKYDITKDDHSIRSIGCRIGKIAKKLAQRGHIRELESDSNTHYYTTQLK